VVSFIVIITEPYTANNTVLYYTQKQVITHKQNYLYATGEKEVYIVNELS
jgi:hypothetical protein